MKNIKSVILPKYSSPGYEPVAFGVHRNSRAGNYCICLTADDMNEFILDALLPQYGLNCTNDYYGQEIVTENGTVCIAEFETSKDSLADLQRIMNFASAVGKEIVDYEVNGNTLLGVRTGEVSFTAGGVARTVPVFSVRTDGSGMLSFEPRYPDIPFTAEMGRCIASKDIPAEMDYKAVLIQGFRAYMILEYKGVTLGFEYGFDEKAFLGMIKGKLFIERLRGYIR